MRDRRVRRQQQLHERLADEDRAPDHDGTCPLQVHVRLGEQLHDARRRAGHERLGAVVHEEAGVGGGEPVDVLGRVDQADELILVEVIGQRQLEQDAVHPLILVEGANQLRELLRRDVAARLVVERLDADLGRVLTLHTDVHG